MADTKLTPAQALARFAKLPPADRSVNRLFANLKAEGHRISRKTLTKWHADENWDERAARLDIRDAAIETTAIAERLEQVTGLGAVRLEDTFESSARVIEAINKTVLGAIANAHVQTVEELRTLVMIASNTAESMAKVHKILGEANISAPMKDVTPAAGPRPAAGALALFQSDFRALRDGYVPA